jgi:tetratricopeptide (TPR) repeat protein
MNGKLVSLIVLLMLALSTLACLPCGLLGGKEAAQPTPEISKPTAVAPTAPPAATPTPSASEHMDLGMEYYEQGEYDEAAAEFQAAIELEPDDAGAHRNLGTAYLEQGKYEEAAAAYEKAIELDPDFGEAYGDLAGAYVNLGRLSEAIAAGEKAIELAPDYAMAYNNLGFAYYTQGMLDEAIAEYQEAIRINPDFDKAHDNLGVAYMMQDQLDEAIAEFKEVIRINPDHVGGHVNLGFAYYTQGMLDEAIAEYQEAIRINPDLALPHKNLGLAYRDQGRAEEAIAEFETYLQLAPDSPNRAAVEEEIAKLKEQAAGAEYRNAAGGYSLLYPEGWYYAEEETEVTLAPSKEDYEAFSLKSPLITFITWPLAETTENFGLEETAAPVKFLQVMVGRLEAETGEMESVEIAGYPAAFAATSGSVEGSPYRGVLIVILVEERFFLAEALAPPEQWETFGPTFVDMVNSLSFFEPIAAEEQPAEAEPSATAEEEEPASGVPTSVPNLTGLPLLDDAEEVYCMDEYNLNYWTRVDLVTALTFYRQELPALGWQLDYQDGKCLDDRRLTRRCMGWHGGYDNPEETPLFFLRGDGEYLTLNASEEGGRVNIIISIDPDVYAD